MSGSILPATLPVTLAPGSGGPPDPTPSTMFCFVVPYEDVSFTVAFEDVSFTVDLTC